MPGQALRIASTDLLKAIDDSSSLRRLLLHYSGTVLIQATQSGICNAQHGLKQRLARWLLLASDRLEDVNLPVTQLSLSRLLGVRRPSVTSCLGVLRDEGLIQINRGLIKLSDMEGLGATACVCHTVIKNAYARLVHDNHAGGAPIMVYGLEHARENTAKGATTRPSFNRSPERGLLHIVGIGCGPLKAGLRECGRECPQEDRNCDAAATHNNK